MTFHDGRGDTINEGDTVCVTHVDRGRGAELWMWHGTVVGFGRTRVRIRFPSRAEPASVGAECLRVVETA